MSDSCPNPDKNCAADWGLGAWVHPLCSPLPNEDIVLCSLNCLYPFLRLGLQLPSLPSILFLDPLWCFPAGPRYTGHQSTCWSHLLRLYLRGRTQFPVPVVFLEIVSGQGKYTAGGTGLQGSDCQTLAILPLSLPIHFLLCRAGNPWWSNIVAGLWCVTNTVYFGMIYFPNQMVKMQILKP